MTKQTQGYTTKPITKRKNFNGANGQRDLFPISEKVIGKDTWPSPLEKITL